MIARENIAKGFRSLGLGEGDCVLVHSSLSSFGRVDGGADSVIDAILDVIGHDGAVSMPTLPWSGLQVRWLEANPIIDLRQTPSITGRITEVFRQRPGVLRSIHPSHPVTSFGRHAGKIVAGPHIASTSCGVGTPFFNNAELDGFILLVGVTNDQNTTLHGVEETVAPDYLYDGRVFATTVIDLNGVQHQVRVRSYSDFGARDFTRFDAQLLELGIMRRTKIGNSTVSLIRAKPFIDFMLDQMRANPHCLLPGSSKPSSSAVPPMNTQSPDDKRAILQELLRVSSLQFLLGQTMCCGRFRHDDEQIEVDEVMACLTPNSEKPVRISVARPRHVDRRLPVVLCLHGTGHGRQYLLEKPFAMDPEQPWLMGWAAEFARRGFAAACFDQRCFGQRGGNIYEEAKIDLLHDRTMLGSLVEEAGAVVTVLGTHRQIDPSRIFVCGFSLGGIVAFHLSVLDTRLAGTICVCGGVGSLRALVDHRQTLYHSSYYYVPKFLRHFDHPELIDCIHPRGLFLVNAEHGDPGMPPDGVEAFVRRAEEVYERFPHRWDEIRSGVGHRFDSAAFDEIEQWLRQNCDNMLIRSNKIC